MSDFSNIFSRINFVIDFWIDPCDAPLEVYAKTALPAALEAILPLLPLRPSDVITQNFRNSYIVPRRKRTRKGRGGSKANKWVTRWSRRVGKWTDPNERVANKLSPWTQGKPVRISGLKAFLWIFEGLAERLLWYIVLFNTVLDFLFGWSTLMIEAGYCDAADDVVLLSQGGDQILIGVQQWVALLAPEVIKQRGTVGLLGNNISINAINWTVAIHSLVKWDSEFTDTSEVAIRATIRKGLEIVRVEETRVETFKKGTVAVDLIVEGTGSMGINVEHEVVSGVATFTEIRFHAHGKPVPIEGEDEDD